MMIKLIYSPEWFHGIDVVIDVFSVLVLLLIAVFALRFYNINKKNKNYFWFSLSFILLSVSFLFKILTNFVIYYNVINTKNLGFFVITYRKIATSHILFSIGFISYMFLYLIGLFILYETYKKKKSKQDIFLFLYFMIIVSYFSTSKYFVFHLTSLIMFLVISLNYFENYKKKKTKNSMMLAVSFFIITLSHLVFIFIELDKVFYVIAEIIQLFGYVLLFAAFMGVVKNAKKK